ncbi:MAG TPA: DUF1801 domain-containing protein [Allosphingosinicella sp.]|nr:DUF1801 domain-containing protein [Allosphingosinicella sp.]
MTERKPADLDAWLAALDHPRKAEVALLVAIALAARPGITGHIKWNAPSFLYAGDDRVTLGLRPNGVLQIVFHRGAKVKDAAGFTFADDSGLIKMVARDRGVVTLAEGEVAAKADALGRLIARWVEAAK